MLRTLALMTALTAPTPHVWQGWGPTALPAATVAYTAVIAVPEAPRTAPAYAYVMAQAPGVAGPFTQVGAAWGIAGYPQGVLFAYTVPTGGTVAPADWVFGEALSPGQDLAVRIERSGTMYADQVYWHGAWATLASGSFVARPLWSTMEETYGPPDPVCFSGRTYQAGTVVRSMPSGCQP